ncbi:MAG: HAMP domain-containing protein, partial [Rubrivivax sp.]|nr:HAMP domain-containing protein [Rubrivivax sp.]
MLRGRITSQLVLAFVALTGLGLIITLGTIALIRVSHDTLTRVVARAEIAALSARIRSESLTLTDIVHNYTLHPADLPATRALLNAQTQLLDALVQQAINATDPNDVEESLSISQVRQNLIAFTLQAGRVLTAHEAEGGAGPLTEQALTLLITNYQQPLIQALRDFEQLELSQTRIAQQQAEQTIELATGLLMATAIAVVIAVAVMIGVVLKRIATPLAKLRAGVEDIRQGRLDQSVAVNSQDEFGELAGAFNMMMAEVRASRRQQEDYARTLEMQVADRTREVERRAQQIGVGAEIGRVATRLLDANELIVRVVELIHQRYGFYYVGLFLIDAERNVAVQRYGLNRDGQVFADGAYEWPVGSASIVGQVCARGEAHIAPDVSRDPWYAPQPRLPDTRSEMALPLRLGERVIGALNVESATPNAFD